MSDPVSGSTRRFHIERLLGAGAYGTVYLARDLNANVRRFVALKLLRMDARQADVERFQREAALLAGFSHPCLVKVHDIFTLDARWCLEMDYIDGVDLGVLLQDQRRVPVAPALELIQSVADALDYVWCALDDRGAPLHVQHRDIKPSNLLLAPGVGVKLLDFGVARIWQNGAPPLTTGTVPASPGYLSPERARGARDFGPESDIFALGAVLYELLTGEALLPPGAALDLCAADEGSYQHLLSRRVALLAQMEGIPEHVPVLLADMCAYTPQYRPAAVDVSRLCGQIRRSLDGGQDLLSWCRATLPVLIPTLAVPSPDERVGRDFVTGVAGVAGVAGNTGITNSEVRPKEREPFLARLTQFAQQLVETLRARIKLVLSTVLTILSLATGFGKELVALAKPITDLWEESGLGDMVDKLGWGYDETQQDMVITAKGIRQTVDGAAVSAFVATARIATAPRPLPATSMTTSQGPLAVIVDAHPDADPPRQSGQHTSVSPRTSVPDSFIAIPPSVEPPPGGDLMFTGSGVAVSYAGSSSGSLVSGVPTKLPPGDYEISAKFNNWDSLVVSKVTIKAGGKVRVECKSLTKECVVSSK